MNSFISACFKISDMSSQYHKCCNIIIFLKNKEQITLTAEIFTLMYVFFG